VKINAYDAARILREALEKHAGMVVDEIEVESFDKVFLTFDLRDGGKVESDRCGARGHRLRPEHARLKQLQTRDARIAELERENKELRELADTHDADFTALDQRWQAELAAERARAEALRADAQRYRAAKLSALQPFCIMDKDMAILCDEEADRVIDAYIASSPGMQRHLSLSATEGKGDRT
jgi:uncharacterized protein YeaO (DUF488 family)